ncbi:MAG TPA: DoxX family protein [Streptosporangiaceae bacterium]|jgi:uncharacterized membrane protein YphA (DoxX/SURF4 family)|nr:DoxX family protein [Streptosporangiaceae bacterium]
MNIVLWVLQGLLAAAFLMAGVTKVSQPKDKLVKQMGWVEDFSDNAVKGVGAVEILAALGLILPAATGIATILTPLAATGLVLTMILAGIVHVRRGEQSKLPINIVLLILAAIVAWGRFGPYSL